MYSEFSFTDSLAGHFSSSLHPLDIDSWNKSVPLEGDNLDFIEMAGQFLEPDVLKDDTQSISSSMNDSAYMSQSDMSHLQGSLVNLQQYQSTQEQSQPTTDGFVHPDVLSPTLSSTSHGAYYTQQNDMNNFMLPPSSRIGGQANMLSQYTNSSSQLFLDNTDSTGSPFPSSGVDSQQLWSHDSQELFTAALLGGNNNSILRSQLNNRRVSRQQNSSVAAPSRFSESGEQDKSSQTHNASTRPQGRRVTFRSCSTPSITTTGLNMGLGSESRPESARRASSNTVQSLHNDFTLAASPTASVASHVGPYSSGGTQADAFSYIDYDGYASMAVGFVHDDKLTSYSGDESLDNMSTTTPTLPSAMPETPTESQPRQKTRAVRPADDAAARSDPLYQRLPGHDDLYHCPFADEGEDCGHKPTKLKCNYE